MIQSGKVKLNGKICRELGVKVDPLTDKVQIEKREIAADRPPLVYWLLNKPDFTLVSRKGQGGQSTIFELPALKKVPFLVSAVGRLDYRTEGLLLLSNDGELVHRLSHPSYSMPRQYQVLISGRLTKSEEIQFRHGIELEDGKTTPSELHFVHTLNLGKSRGSWYYLTVHEGRNRLVRRMFAAVGHEVVRLIRVGFGELRLTEDHEPGTYRQLTSKEIKTLKRAVNLISPARDNKPRDNKPIEEVP